MKTLTIVFLLIASMSQSAFADWCRYEKTSGVVVSVSKEEKGVDAKSPYEEVECQNGIDIGEPGVKWDGSKMVIATSQDKTNLESALVEAHRQHNRELEKSSLDSSTYQNQAFKAFLRHYVQHLNTFHGQSLTMSQVVDAIKTQIDNGNND